jgi:hypothetical protein
MSPRALVYVNLEEIIFEISSFVASETETRDDGEFSSRSTQQLSVRDSHTAAAMFNLLSLVFEKK